MKGGTRVPRTIDNGCIVVRDLEQMAEHLLKGD